MKQEDIRELVHRIVEGIRKNTSVDWNKRDDVKAKLRLMVKKLLKRYGYPPDLILMAVDSVLEQSDLLASELADA